MTKLKPIVKITIGVISTIIYFGLMKLFIDYIKIDKHILKQVTTEKIIQEKNN